MLHEFLGKNRAELISRCQAKVAARSAPRATFAELEHGIPLFLAQLTRMLPGAGVEAGGTRADMALEAGATKHGEELYAGDFSVEQVVHDYGDLCQSITELALEQDARITSQEFGILNIKLDNAIAAAVSEYQSQNDKAAAQEVVATSERVAQLVGGIGDLLNTAVVAVSVIKRGHVGMQGATAAALDRSLAAIRELLDRTLLALRADAGPARSEIFELAPFLANVRIAAALDATQLGRHLTIGHVTPGVFVVAERHVVASAIASLLRAASRLAREDGDVVLTARESTACVLIEIQGERGGEPAAADLAAADLALAAIRDGIEATGGTLRFSEASGKRFLFTLGVPRKMIAAGQP